MTTPGTSLTVKGRRSLSSALDVRLRERQVLFVAPDNEGTRQWGVYGCPDMYRADDGSIVVYDGGHMDTYDAESIPFTGDALWAPLRWRGEADLSELKGKRIQLRVRLSSAKIFGCRLNTG